MHKLISIVIVNWNGDKIIRECLDSIIKQEYQDYEIIVVDNGSTDNSVTILESEYDRRIKLIKLGGNYGFAKANNIGLLHSNGEYIFTLNNDAIIDESFFDHLQKAINRNKSGKIGMIVPTILNYYNRNIVDSIGLSVYPDGIGRGRFRDKDINDIEESIIEVLCPSGCAALYKTEMLKNIGFFDENFFMYCEDLDLGLRARLAGWQCIYCKDAIVYHMCSYSAGDYTATKLYYAERNRIYVLLKNFPISICFFSVFFTLYRYIFQFITMYQSGVVEKLKEDTTGFNIIKVLLQAYVDAFSSLQFIINERRKLSKTRRYGIKKFLLLLIKFRSKNEELAIRFSEGVPTSKVVLSDDSERGGSYYSG